TRVKPRSVADPCRLHCSFPLQTEGACMYYNSNGEKVSRARWKEMYNAFKNRQELVKAGLTSRRDLMRLGLLTGAGMLVAKTGLSSRAWAGTWGSGSCRTGTSGCGTCASPT